MAPEEMAKLTAQTSVKAEKIRILYDAGAARADIARFLEISYQHVQNVLKRSGKLAPPEDSQSPIDRVQLWNLDIDKRGRVTLPAEWIASENVTGTTKLLCRREDDGLRILTNDAAKDALRQAVRRSAPEDAWLVEAVLEMKPPTPRQARERFAKLKPYWSKSG